jgi:hypothetical protein
VLAFVTLVALPAQSAAAATIRLDGPASCIALGGTVFGTASGPSLCVWTSGNTFQDVKAGDVLQVDWPMRTGSNAFANNGTIQVLNGADWLSTVDVTNNGTITVDAGASVRVAGGTFTNNGTITVACGGSFDVLPGTSGVIAGTAPVRADCTAPTATPSLAPVANAAGWNKSDVTVTWNWVDNAGGTGIDPANCPASSTSSGEGTLTMTGTCADLAGNPGTASVTVKVDKTPPTLNITGGPTSAATYSYGSVPAAPTCTASDATPGSGVDSNGCVVSGYSTAVGNHDITFTAADVAGNSVTTGWSYSVTQADQTITFTAPASPAVIGGSATLAASASSGLPVTFSVDTSSTPGACTVTGSTVSYTGVGSCVINADQAGDGNYHAADEVQHVVKVVKNTQTITFTGPASPAVVGATASLSASATSSLPVAFSIDTSSAPGACSVTGTLVSYTGVGGCVIDANQAGNAIYEAAPQQQRTVLLAYTSPGFTSPLSKVSLPKSGSNIPVKFTLTTANGKAIPAATAARLASTHAITVTLTGPGLSVVTVPCTWDSGGAQFQCQLKTPTGLKTGVSNPYTITAYQSVPTAGGGTTAVPVSKETVYFK